MGEIPLAHLHADPAWPQGQKVGDGHKLTDAQLMGLAGAAKVKLNGVYVKFSVQIG